MDQQTKQWIVDRVIWIVGLVMAVLLAAPSFAREHERGAEAGDFSKRTVHIPQ